MNGSIPDTAHDVVIDNNVTVNQDDTVASITVSATNSLTLNATHGLTVSGNLTNNGTITASSGASLIVGGTSTGNITYNVNVTDTNWHLIASPVSDEQYNDAWVTANSIPTSTLDVDNKAIATYDNTSLDTDSDGAGTSDSATGHWRYFEGGTDVTFGSGIGYSLKRTASGNYTFTGTYPDGTIAPAISQS